MPFSFSPEAVAPATLPALSAAQPVLWLNDAQDLNAGFAPQVGADRVAMAVARMRRFAPLLARVFAELGPSAGHIESPLIDAGCLQQALGLPPQHGKLWIKADHSLPVAGSVKARGGFHEVLEFAENLALRHGLLDANADYAVLAQAQARALFSNYRVAVGSTGNLGMAIGIMAAALGFEAIVHMSADARAWKKAHLRSHGVKVIEYSGDYAQAVAAGRQQAAQDTHTHFVDDEASLSLMLGYAGAGQEVKAQLDAAGIAVDATHPLLVYLPCGVGGAPAGISIGLKQALGPHVHCFFAEPVQSPCFVLRMMQGEAAASSVYDIGLSNRTEADGLAVPRASELAAQVMHPLLEGAYTVQDHTLFEALAMARDAQELRIEPSAAAGLPGPLLLTASGPGRAWLTRRGLLPHLANATHLAWTTGGAKVPDEEYASFYARGKG